MVAAVLHHEPPAPAAERTGDLRVVSWNIAFAHRTHRAARALEWHPDLRDSDVVLLQEMDERGTAEIAGHLGMSYAYVAASVHPQTDRNFGNAVLSRWTLSDVEVVHLPYLAALQGQPRVALGATVQHPAVSIRAFSVHSETPILTRRKRLLQFVALGDAVDRWPDVPVVVGGDFNTASSRSIREVDEELAGRTLQRVSAGAGPTLRRAGRRFELDHVFAARLRPVAAGTADAHGASDHRPIRVDLSLSRGEDVTDGTTGGPRRMS